VKKKGKEWGQFFLPEAHISAEDYKFILFFFRLTAFPLGG
jgi:hypothetical protein